MALSLVIEINYVIYLSGFYPKLNIVMAEKPEDLNLPMAVVTRITKEALPDGCMISKEARLALSKAAR